MSTLLTAVTIALACKRRIAITCDDPEAMIDLFLRSGLTMEVVDVNKTLPHPSNCQLQVWKGLQMASASQQKKLYTQIMHSGQSKALMSPVATFSGTPEPALTESEKALQETKPAQFCLVIAILDPRLLKSSKLYPYLKQQFWFSVYPLQVPHDNNWGKNAAVTANVMACTIPEVYVDPDIKRYIHSLVIFTRQHRMASLAAREVRLATPTIDAIRELAVALVAYQKGSFVTPDVVKVAYKRVAFWLVDWEVNLQFSEPSTNEFEEYERRYQLAVMVGDWCGSEFDASVKFIDEYRLEAQHNSPTGRSNLIVEDVLQMVRPPI